MNQNRPLDVSKLFSLEAEAAVIGSMIIDPKCIAKVLPMLPRPETYCLPEHQILHDTLTKMFLADKPIDAVLLRDELKQQDKLKEIKGNETDSVRYIGELMSSVPSSANVVYYAKIVRAKEKERQLRCAVEEIANIPDEPGSVDEMIQRIQGIALELEPTKSGPDYVDISKAAAEAVDDMRTETKYIKTGFRSLDKLIGGFCDGESIIIAGRPSMGKSALMLDMAMNMSRSGLGVLMFSLEMTPKGLGARAICSQASFDMSRIQTGEMDDFDFAELRTAAANLQEYNLKLSTIGDTPAQIAGLLHRLRQTHGISICFIDYVQLMSSGKKSESRQQEITSISRTLKQIALRENIPIVILSQLNRQVDSREDKRPRLSDLRESGSLEQDADLVLMLYREDYYNQNEPGFKPSGIAEILVKKNRRGPVGKAKLVFVHDYTKFSDLPQNHIGSQYE